MPGIGSKEILIPKKPGAGDGSLQTFVLRSNGQITVIERLSKL